MCNRILTYDATINYLHSPFKSIISYSFSIHYNTVMNVPLWQTIKFSFAIDFITHSRPTSPQMVFKIIPIIYLLISFHSNSTAYICILYTHFLLYTLKIFDKKIQQNLCRWYRAYLHSSTNNIRVLSAIY